MKIDKPLARLIRKKYKSISKVKNQRRGPDIVAHTYNLSCEGGRDQKNHILRPAWAKVRKTPMT
jgi:hypothetical protein